MCNKVIAIGCTFFLILALFVGSAISLGVRREVRTQLRAAGADFHFGPGMIFKALGSRCPDIFKPIIGIGLSGNDVTDRELSMLGSLGQLEWINVYNSPITGDGFSHLDGRMVAVRSLSLIGCKNLNSDLVANIPHLFPNLEELQLTGSRVSDDDILWIVDCKKLRELRVDETNVTGRGVEILLADRSWERIEYPGKGTLREVNKKTIDSNDNSDIP